MLSWLLITEPFLYFGFLVALPIFMSNYTGLVDASLPLEIGLFVASFDGL
jgi:hypothetical protein